MLFKLFEHDEDHSSSQVGSSIDIRRWIVLALFCLYSSSNAIQWITFAPIASNVISFFNMNTSQLNLLSSVYMIVFAAGAYFTCTTFEKWGVRRGLLIGSLANALGSILKVAPGLQYPSYASMMGPQVLNALAQLFVLSTPPLIAAQYFEPHQRAFATAVASTSNNIGNAIALAIPPVIVREGTHKEFMLLFSLEMGYCVFVFIGIVLFLQPPRYSSPSRALLLRNGMVSPHNNFSANDIDNNGHGGGGGDDDNDDNLVEELLNEDDLQNNHINVNRIESSCGNNINESNELVNNNVSINGDEQHHNLNVNEEIVRGDGDDKLFNVKNNETRKNCEEREESTTEENFTNNCMEFKNDNKEIINKCLRERYFNGTSSSSTNRKSPECYYKSNAEANEEMFTVNKERNKFVAAIVENKTNQSEPITATIANYSDANKSMEVNAKCMNNGNACPEKRASNELYSHNQTNKQNYCDVGSESKRKRLSAWHRLMMNAHVIQFFEVGHVIGQLMRRRDFVFLLLAFSISMGSVWTFASVLAQILEPFGVSATAAGLAGALNVVVGTIAAYLVGFWVDQSHRFKWPLVICLGGSIVCCVGLICLMWRAPAFTNFMTYMSCSIYIIAGIFQNTAVPICFEFAMEITYPLAESVPGALLMAGANVIGLVLLSAASAMLGDGLASRKSCLFVLILITCICFVGTILSVLPREQLHRQQAIADAQSAANNAPEE